MNGELPLSNGKFETFCQLVAQGASYTEAGTKAGYSKATAAASASRLMKKAEIELRVQYLRSLVAEKHAEITTAVVTKHALTKEWVIEQLMENVMIAKAAVPVIVDGEETGEYRTNIPAANKALELLGQEIGMFNKNVNLNLNATDPLSDFIKSITSSALPIARQPITVEQVEDDDE